MHTLEILGIAANALALIGVIQYVRRRITMNTMLVFDLPSVATIALPHTWAWGITSAAFALTTVTVWATTPRAQRREKTPSRS